MRIKEKISPLLAKGELIIWVSTETEIGRRLFRPTASRTIYVALFPLSAPEEPEELERHEKHETQETQEKPEKQEMQEKQQRRNKNKKHIKTYEPYGIMNMRSVIGHAHNDCNHLNLNRISKQKTKLIQSFIK